MNERILVIGSEGNMGKRYRAILDYLGKGYICADKEQSLPEIVKRAEKSAGVIIATPTDTHADFALALASLKKPILCEKPIDKDPGRVVEVLREASKHGTPFSMVYQYGVLPDGQKGRTSYNYYRHGSDGLVWDCIQIIGLARDEVELSEDSPIWRCILNGRAQNIAAMDMAYIKFIDSWLKKPGQDVGFLKELHLRTADIEKDYRNGRCH